ncbi:GtrA family protein [Undibacterium sp. RuRC25W]|uniref:GtrA family protein n=1 Tax=Undibacterium sp. RuRC25W TaxID=3413047 RepID=UPI003BF07C2A
MSLLNKFKSGESKKIRYLVIGAWNTCAGCAIFSGIYYLLGKQVHYLLIAILSHMIAVFQSWLMYRRFVFNSHAPMLNEYLRFNVSSLFVLGIQLSGLWVLVDFCGFHPVFSQPPLVILTVVIGYVVHNRFSFRAVSRDPLHHE